MRDVAKSLWHESGADLSVCDFCMGHIVDKLGNDKIHALSPNYAVKQFKQTESHLSISKVSIPSDKAVPRREYETRLKEQQEQITQLQEQLKELRKGPEFIDLKVDVWDKVSAAIKLVEISSQSDMDKLLNKIEAELKKPYMKSIREHGLNLDKLEPDDLLKRQIRLVEDAINNFKEQKFEELREKLRLRQEINV